MTPLPKRRHSTQRQGKRRASLKLKQKSLFKCQDCGSYLRSHRVCPNCGNYKGQKVVKTKSERKITRKEKRAKKEKENPS